MEKICGIYKITSPSGRVYIGQSVHIYDRWRNYKNIHCRNQVKIYKSIQKYGYNNHKFEILVLCEKEKLNELEMYYISIFNSVNSGLNIKEGGNRPTFSDETRKKISIANKGRRFSIEWKKNISIGLRGKPKSKEHIANMCKSLKGRYGHMTGKKHPIESIEKMRKAKLGKKASQETKNKMSRSRLGKKLKGRLIINIKTNEEYMSIREAAIKNNINLSTLSARLTGRIKNKGDLVYKNH